MFLELQNLLAVYCQENWKNIALFSISGACFSLFIFLILRSRMSDPAMLPMDAFKAYVDSIITNAEAIRSNLVSWANIQAGNVTQNATANNSVVQALTQQVASLQTQLTAAQSVTAGTAVSDPAIVAENAKLKAEMEVLKKATATATASAGVATDPSLANKMKDLEAKLHEYEVIVEDLANLKEYKNENEKLKKEIEALKSGGAVASAPAVSPEPPVPEAPSPPPQVASPPEPVVAPPEVVAEQPKAPAPTPVEVKPDPIPVVAASAPSPAPSANPAQTEQQLDELVNKVEEKLEVSPSPPVEAAPAGEELSDQDKALLEEFEKMIGDDKSAPPPTSPPA